MPHIQSSITIGIPTYNRVEQLKRAIESALNQDYRNIEIIISDNASTDGTELICRKYCAADSRIKYTRQSENLGPTANFAAVLRIASGEYFMWLGDDDWLDNNYVSSCFRELSSDPKLSLVGGTPEYYSDDRRKHTGKYFNLLYEPAWLRVIGYYLKVADNGMFYGLMRTKQVRQIKISNSMGGDWLLIAGINFLGKVKTLNETKVHRDLGGATASYKKISKLLDLSKFESIFPKFSIAVNAWRDIANTNNVYCSKSRSERMFIASLVFFLLVGKTILHFAKTSIRWIASSMRKIWMGVWYS